MAVRSEAYWVKRPAFRPAGVVHLPSSRRRAVRRQPSFRRSTTQVYCSTSFLRDAPLKAYFDFTNRCNLSCRHCITSSSPQVDTSAELPTWRILDLILSSLRSACSRSLWAAASPSCIPDWAHIFRHVTLQV
jgi:hypothetical protein